MNYGIDVDDISEKITSICESEYGPMDRSGTMLVKDQPSSVVRQNILDHIDDPDMKKMKYLDLCAYFLDVKDGTLITMHRIPFEKE